MIPLLNRGHLFFVSGTVYGQSRRCKTFRFDLRNFDQYEQLVEEIHAEFGQIDIINLASLLSFQGGLTVPAYAANKGAVMQFTKSLSNEWARQGVNVNCIAPGYMATEMNTA